MPIPHNTKTLILNQDYLPLNIVRWKKGFIKSVSNTTCEHCGGIGRIVESEINHQCFDCGGTGDNPRCSMVVSYPSDKIHLLDTKGIKHLVPSVLANNHMVHRTLSRVPFSKPNVIRRDGARCQYCGDCLSPYETELEHVVPRSRWTGPGTPTDWHNIVISCKPCNNTKADRTPEEAGMSLRKTIEREDGSIITVPYKRPKQPNYTQLILGLDPYHLNLPDEWLPYIKPLLGDKMYKALFGKSLQ
jgi:5-methylcytosine-specific restriction endonuclease McrA